VIVTTGNDAEVDHRYKIDILLGDRRPDALARLCNRVLL